jgi:RNA polymerase sigma factor for flagellar operon FliA
VSVARRIDGTPGVTETLWARYRGQADLVARTRLLDNYLGLVHHAARELAPRCSREVELDDLIGAGSVGLVQALEGFDPSRGLAFSTYAVPRIRGAMLDELRSRDWMPRTVRLRRRLIARAHASLQQRLGRGPEARELAEALGISLAAYWRWVGETDARVMLALHHAADAGAEEESRLFETIPDLDSREPGEAITHEETLAELREAFATLPEKERLVLSLYYYEELSLRQIGELLHVTESRVSQIRARALQRLRERVQLVEENR